MIQKLLFSLELNLTAFLPNKILHFRGENLMKEICMAMEGIRNLNLTRIVHIVVMVNVIHLQFVLIASLLFMIKRTIFIITSHQYITGLGTGIQIK